MATSKSSAKVLGYGFMVQGSPVEPLPAPPPPPPEREEEEEGYSHL